jgi:hypothetical protein
MARPYSLDLREREVAAVEKGGMPRNAVAAHFGVGISTTFKVALTTGGATRFACVDLYGAAAPGIRRLPIHGDRSHPSHDLEQTGCNRRSA